MQSVPGSDGSARSVARRLGWRCCIYGDLSGFIFRRPTPSPSWRSPLCATQRSCPSTQSCASTSLLPGEHPKTNPILPSLRRDYKEHRCHVCFVLCWSQASHVHRFDIIFFLKSFGTAWVMQHVLIETVPSCPKLPGACSFILYNLLSFELWLKKCSS